MEVLGASEVAREFPGLGMQGQRAVRCRATAQVHVPQLVAALRAACVAASVTLHEHAPVSTLEYDAGHVSAIHTVAGRVPVEYLLVTAAALGQELSPRCPRPHRSAR